MSYSADGAALVDELRYQGFSGSIVGADGIADLAWLNDFSDESLADGVLAVRPSAVTYESQRGQDFGAACYNDSDCSGGIYTAETYDAITIVAEAFILSQMFGETLEDSLHYVGYHWEGASNNITFNEDGDIAGWGFDVCEFVHHSGNQCRKLA